MIVIIKQAPSFLCNDNHGSNRVRIDYQKHAQKAPSLPHSKPKWYSYPNAPVERDCRATWSECGGYNTNTIDREKVAAVTKSLPFGEGKHRRRHSACR